MSMIGDGTKELLSVEAKMGEPHRNKDLTGIARYSLWQYEYIGRSKKNDFPIYQMRDDRDTVGDFRIVFLLNEWEGNDEGFKGWIGTVILVFTNFKVINIMK